MNYLFSNLGRREKDVRDERFVAEYLDGRFYNLWTSYSFRNTNDLSQQYRGVDITVDVDNFEYIIDEKAATHYIGSNLQTFAQELSFYDRGGHFRKGWFMNEENMNDSYVYVWIDEADTTYDEHLYDSTSIKKLTAALVTKYDINRHLSSIGWTKEKLWKKQEQIREAYKDKGEDFWKYVKMGKVNEDGIAFRFSPKFSESPVNVLLSRDLLVNKLATFSVSFDGKDDNILVNRV